MPLHHVERGQPLTVTPRSAAAACVHWPRAADAALETNEKSGGGPEAEDRETVVCHQAPAAPSQQICKRARADQSASLTALWLDCRGFIRLRRRQRLRRRALDLLPAPRVDDDAAENYFGAAATVRIGRCGELMRQNLR